MFETATTTSDPVVFAGVRGGANVDRAAGRRVTIGVRQQVQHNLTHAHRIGMRDESGLGVHVDAWIVFEAGGADSRCDERRDLDGRGMQAQFACFREREFLEIVDELSEVQHLVAHVAIRGGGRGRQAVHPRFQPAAQRRQRRAQFVRDVVQQAAPQRVLALQLRGHRIESPPEIRHFARAAHVHPPIEFPGTQIARRRAQLRDRADDAPADHPGRGDRQQRRQRRHQQRAAIERAEKRRRARIVRSLPSPSSCVRNGTDTRAAPMAAVR